MNKSILQILHLSHRIPTASTSLLHRMGSILQHDCKWAGSRELRYINWGSGGRYDLKNEDCGNRDDRGFGWVVFMWKVRSRGDLSGEVRAPTLLWYLLFEIMAFGPQAPHPLCKSSPSSLATFITETEGSRIRVSISSSHQNIRPRWERSPSSALPPFPPTPDLSWHYCWGT